MSIVWIVLPCLAYSQPYPTGINILQPPQAGGPRLPAYPKQNPQKVKRHAMLAMLEFFSPKSFKIVGSSGMGKIHRSAIFAARPLIHGCPGGVTGTRLRGLSYTSNII